jgi:hypothetical protein
MTGPEHYREAEELLLRASDDSAYDSAYDIDVGRFTSADLIAQAQVHATLALAAATAEAAPVNRGPLGGAWAEITKSRKRPEETRG